MSDEIWLASEGSGATTFRIGRVGADTLVAEWSGIGRLLACRDGSGWRFDPHPNAPGELIEKLRHGSIPSLLHHLRGAIALHGSAVSCDGVAVVFIGRSGMGKSTLAAQLCAREGASLLADDASTLREEEVWLVEPQETHHYLAPSAVTTLGSGWMRPSARSEKQRVPASRVHQTPCRLRAIVDLAFDEMLPSALERLEGIHAVGALIPQVVRFVLDEPARLASELDTLARLIEVTPVYRFRRRRDLGDLANVSRHLQPLWGSP